MLRTQSFINLTMQPQRAHPLERNPKFDKVKDGFFLTRWVHFHAFINIFRSLSRRLRVSDLFNLAEKYWPEHNVRLFSRIKEQHQNAGLLTLIFGYFIFWEYCLAGVLALVGAALQLVGPLAIKEIITFLVDDQFNPENKRRAEIYAALLVSAYFVRIFIVEYSNRMFFMNGLRVGQVLHHQLLLKISRMSFEKKVRAQKIYMANNMIISTDKIAGSISASGVLFSLPATAIMVQTVLFVEFGYYGFSFLGSFVIGILVQSLIDRRIAYLNLRLQSVQHEKNGTNCQFVRSFKEIRTLGWQNLIIDKNNQFRQQENKVNSRIYRLRGLFDLTAGLIPIIAVLLSIILYSTIHDNKSIDPVVVFTIITYCGLISNLNDIYQPIQGFKTVKKIQRELQAEQLKISPTYDKQMEKGRLLLTKVIAKWRFEGLALEKIQDMMLLDRAQYDFEDEPLQKEEEPPHEPSQEPQKHNSDPEKIIKYQGSKQQSLHELLLPKAQKQLQGSQKQRIAKIKQEVANKFEKLEILQNFQFQRSRLIVIGDMESGKSSFLHMIMGNLSIQEGIAKYGGRIGYMPQNVWFQRASVRDNILFGCELDVKWLKTVYQWLDIREEMKLLDNGDQTMINENLFMTQKQRKKIALARAIYCRPDILIMDEPFLFLDSEKSKLLYSRLCKEFEDKIIVIATKSPQFVNSSDHVLIIEYGKIVESGKFQDIRSNPKSVLHKIYRPELSKINIVSTDNRQLSILQRKKRARRIKILREKVKRFVKELLDMTRGKSRQQIDRILQEKCGVMADRPKQIEREQSTERIRSIPFSSIKRLFNIYPSFFILLFFISALIQTIAVYSMYWIGSQELPWQITYQTQLIIYFVLIFFYSALWCLSSLLIPHLSARVANTVVSQVTKSVAYMQHSKAIKEAYLIPTLTLNKPTAAYYNLNLSIQRIIYGYITLFISIVLVSITSPVFVGIGVGVSILYFFTQYYLLRAQREIYTFEYLEYPITSLYQQTITGIETFRAFYRVNQHLDKSRDILYNQTVFRANHRFVFHGISIICKLLGLGLLAGAVFFAISAKGRLPDYSVGLLGASISFILDLSSMLNDIITEAVGLSNILYDTIQEDFQTIDYPLDAAFFSPKKPSKWPTDGAIQFKDAQLTNTIFDEAVVKNLTMKIESGEQIALFGSDDIAKMAIIYSLLRYYDNQNQQGYVKFSDYSVYSVGRKYLLEEIRILSTDPFSFRGSVRQNMDPFLEHTDAQLIEVLRKTKAWDRLKIKEGEDSDQNRLNQGFTDRTRYDLLQRVNISRALLKDPKALICLSITDALNRKSAGFLQDLIMSEFKRSTRIFISQNRETIIKADKVAFVEKSKLKDFGPPTEILNKRYKITVKKQEQEKIEMKMAVEEVKKEVEAELQQQNEQRRKDAEEGAEGSGRQPSTE